MSDQQQPVSVQALVEAIDQRARQAGTEGATTVLRGLIGSVSDTLSEIEARLAAIEAAGAGSAAGGGADTAVVTAIDERLQALNARLGRLEEAFVQAVEDSSAGTVSISDRVVEAVTAYMDSRLPADAVAAGDGPAGPDEGGEAASPAAIAEAAAAAAVDALRAELDRRDAEAEARNRSSLAELRTQVAEGLTGLQRSLTSLAEVQGGSHEPAWKAELAAAKKGIDDVLAATDRVRVDLSRSVEAAVADLRSSSEPTADRVAALARSVDQLAAKAASPTAAADPGLDKPTRAAIDRMAADIERLLRQEQSGRLVQLVEARMGTGLDAMVRRVEALAAEVAEVRDRVEASAEVAAATRESADAARASAASTGDRVRDQLGKIGSIDSRVSELGDRVRRLAEGIPDLERTMVARMDAQAGDVSDVKEAISGLASSAEAARQAGEQARDRAREALESVESVRGLLSSATDGLGDRVRTESEQLTQRVAALSAGVERLRQAVDALAEESAQSLGKRATEVGRRLAADWGFRSKRPPDADDRGRALGPGR